MPVEVRLYREYGLLPFWHRTGLPLGKLFKLNTRCCGPNSETFLFLHRAHCFCCLQRGVTQTSSSHSSSTLLPCNFSVECPTHPLHITALSLTPPTPWKTLHASTYTATWPKYTAPLSLLLSACSDTLYALTTTGFPLCHKQSMCVFACVNVLHVHPTVYLFFPWSSSCETSRKASIILMTITTCISICWPQMSRRAAVWLDSESA